MNNAGVNVDEDDVDATGRSGAIYEVEARKIEGEMTVPLLALLRRAGIEKVTSEPVMASQMRSPLDKNWHLYSLYTLIPDVPALPVMPSRRSVNPDLGAMHRTVHLMDRGPALSVLDHVMVKEVKHEDRLNVQVAGIHRRKLKAAATLGEHDGDDNEDDDDQEDRDYPTAGGDAGDEVSEDSRRSRPAKAVSRRRAQGRRKRRHKQDIRAELPQIPRPQVDLPESQCIYRSLDLCAGLLTCLRRRLSVFGPSRVCSRDLRVLSSAKTIFPYRTCCGLS